MFGITIRGSHSWLLAAHAALALIAPSSAFAVDENVKSACKSDYFQHCSQHALGSQELRQCMRKIGEDLSTPCLVALVKAGEVTKEEIEKYKAKHSSPKPPAGTGATKATAVRPSTKPKQPVAKATTKSREASAAQKSTTVKAKSKTETAKVTSSEPRAAAKSSKPAATRSSNTAKVTIKPITSARPISARTSTALARQPATIEKKLASIPAISGVGINPLAPVEPVPLKVIKAPQVAGWTSSEPQSTPPSLYTHNVCRTNSLNGKAETFTCALDQRCCYGTLFNERYCVPAAKKCF